MSHLLFIDESGQDHRDSPYEVLAGVSLEDRQLWPLINDIHALEDRIFGRRYSEGPKELKAKKLLKRKTYRLANQLEPMDAERRRSLARSCLDKGDAARGTRDRSPVTRDELTALNQAKIVFVEALLDLCRPRGVAAFASIMPLNAPRQAGYFLRKDYSYLFERFYYYLEDYHPDSLGLVIFDELEKTRSHILLDQMTIYFRQTHRGRERASKIIPEPFFVHSDLTTAVQVADLVAYITSWAVRFGPMGAVHRPELSSLAEKVMNLRPSLERRPIGGQGWGSRSDVYSFVYIDDLRPREERLGQ